MIRAILLAALLAAAIGTPAAGLAQKLDKSAAAPAPADSRNAALARAAMLGRQAEALLGSDQPAEALPLLDEVLRIRRSVLGGEHPDTLKSLNNYAFALDVLGQSAAAEPLYAELLGLARRVFGARDPRTATTLNNYAGVLESLGRAAEAEPLYAEALLVRREVLGERHPDTLVSLNNYAFVLEALGQPEQAEPLYAEALRLQREVLGERDPATLATLNNYAQVLDLLGRSAQAEPLMAEALRLTREVQGERHPDTLGTLGNYGLLLRNLGRANEAEPLLAEALRLQREVLGEHHPDTLNMLNNYALALKQLGRGAEAEPLFAEALEARRAVLGERHPDTLSSLNNHAFVLWDGGRREEAAALFAQVLEQQRAVLGERHPETLASLANNAVVAETLGRLAEAEALYLETLRLGREVLGPRHPLTLTTLNNYALLLVMLDRAEAAEPLLAEALTIQREALGPRHPDTLLSLGNRARLLRELGRAGDALPLARELAATTRARAGELSDGGLRGSLQRNRERADRQGVERFLADVLWARFAVDPSQPALLQEAFTALQLASAGSTTQSVADAAAARFAADRGLREEVRERRELAREWAAIEAALVAAQAGGEGAQARRAELSARLGVIEARLVQIDARLAADAPQYFAIQRPQAVDMATLRAQLGADEAVLFLVPTQGGTHSMAVTRETIRWQRADLDETAVTQAVSRLRKGLEIAGGGELPSFSLTQAHDLYRQLIAPVEDGLAGKARVYVVADGALSRLPLGTLVTEPPAPGADPDDPAVLRATRWLADRYALVQLPSLQALVYVRAFARPAGEVPDAGFLGFGAPALRGTAALRGARAATLAPVEAASLLGTARSPAGTALMDPAALRRLAALPGTRTELQRVSAALGGGDAALRLDAAMTEPAIRTADLSGVRVLHLATHAFTSEEAGTLGEPGLVFTPPAQATAADDGYLAASEVVSLALTSARWVILSACNTASPSGRPGETGLSGLAQAFFYAGAESLLVSHWPVFDDIAPVITLEALTASAAGTPRAEALQAAQRKVREDPALDAAHPAVWAPFSLVGEGR